MKLKLSLPNGKCFIIPEEIQAAMLTLVSQCKVYTEDGWSDYTYSPSDELPAIAYVGEDKINGYKEAMLEANKAAKKASDEASTNWMKNYNSEKKIKELEETIAELKQNTIIAVPTDCNLTVTHSDEYITQDIE